MPLFPSEKRYPFSGATIFSAIHSNPMQHVVNATRLKLWNLPFWNLRRDFHLTQKTVQLKLNWRPFDPPRSNTAQSHLRQNTTNSNESTLGRSTSLKAPHNTGACDKTSWKQSSLSTLLITPPQSSGWWVANLHLQNEERLLLDWGHWLSDRLIDAIIRLVTSQLSGVANQSTLFALGTWGLHLFSLRLCKECMKLIIGLQQHASVEKFCSPIACRVRDPIMLQDNSNNCMHLLRSESVTVVPLISSKQMEVIVRCLLLDSLWKEGYQQESRGL